VDYVVDTHPIVWFLSGARISARARRVLGGSESHLIVPTIVLAEIKYLKARGRIRPSLTDVMAAIEGDERMTVYPFDESVVARIPTRLELHDAIIVATALVFQATTGQATPVVTRDQPIVDSGLIRTIW
jgi:predicted nucleic acid-binding protein